MIFIDATAPHFGQWRKTAGAFSPFQWANIVEGIFWSVCGGVAGGGPDDAGTGDGGAGEGRPGIEIFTYGRRGDEKSAQTNFPARQTLIASAAIARLHQLAESRRFFVKQNPSAIDGGAFHNDVVAVGHRDLLFLHQQAWEDQATTIGQIKRAFETLHNSPLHVVEVSDDELSLREAIQTYLFNSQLITLADGSIAIIAPIECRDHAGVQRVLKRVLAQANPIGEVYYVDVRQSMRNGGGPACLRLRVMLNEIESTAMHQGMMLSDGLYRSLRAWVERHYREELSLDDLADPKLLDESRAALDELTGLLQLGSIYEFQR